MKWCLYLLLAAVCLLVTGCGARPHHARVIAVYQEDVDANDGVIKRAWYTTIHLDNGGRALLRGVYGATGDVFTAYYTPGEGWGCSP